MLTAVASRFGFDGEDWNLARLRRWYDRHVRAFEEELAMMPPETRDRVLDAMRRAQGGR
jgi:hypothetical protein